MNALRRRGPVRGPRPRDIRCHTRTPAAREPMPSWRASSVRSRCVRMSPRSACAVELLLESHRGSRLGWRIGHEHLLRSTCPDATTEDRRPTIAAIAAVPVDELGTVWGRVYPACLRRASASPGVLRSHRPAPAVD